MMYMKSIPGLEATLIAMNLLSFIRRQFRKIPKGEWPKFISIYNAARMKR